jgi:hypothetical protein
MHFALLRPLPLEGSTRAVRPGFFVIALVQWAIACGGASGGAMVDVAPGRAPQAETPASPAEVLAATHPCGNADQVHTHDLDSDKPTEAFSPCAKGGASDYSGLVRIETIPEGIHIIIQATDDDVDNGVLGSDVKTRDAVIVYPKGRNSKEFVEVPLIKTKMGYTGDKIVLFDQLDKLNDEGTKIDVAIFDHDKNDASGSEEMHLSVAVSTGKSCERAIDDNPQALDMTKKGGGGADLTDSQLGAPLNSGQFMAGCGLAASANADLCVAVKQGKPLGVSVKVSPRNNQTAACIDRAARRVRFPASDKLDVVHSRF